MKFLLSALFFLTLTPESPAQNGRLLSSNLLDIETLALRAIVSNGDFLRSEYLFANNLTYSEIVYESDGLQINGLKIEPRIKGKYPFVIFNRGGNRSFYSLNLKMLFFQLPFSLIRDILF